MWSAEIQECVWGEGRKIDISEKVSRKRQEKSECLKPSLKAFACDDIEFGFLSCRHWKAKKDLNRKAWVRPHSRISPLVVREKGRRL